MKILNTSFFLLIYCISRVIVLGQDYPGSLQDDEQRGGFSLYGVVQGGEASFSSVGEEFQVTASDGALIDYYNFDIPAGETVRFIQPGSDATVVNRILAQTPSLIDGNLFGNGKVVLLNSFGVVFGESAVVEVGKLHAIAGSDMQQSYSLAGTVSNAGSIKADEVVLAGTSVTNTGTILVEDGSLVIAAGSMIQLANEDNSLTITLSSRSPSPVGGAADIAGQAILQSGIIQVSKAQFHGDTITHSGTTQANSVQVGNYSSFSTTNEDLGTSGSLVTNELTVAGGYSPSSNPSFELSGKTNNVSSLLISGTHQDITVRSSTTLTVGEANEGKASPIDVTNLDLRVESGDLKINSKIGSYYSGSVLLAAEKNVIFNSTVGAKNYILYSNKLIDNISELDQDEVDSRLDGSSISIDDLSFNLLMMNENQGLLPSAWFDTLLKNNPNDEGLDMLSVQPEWPVYLNIQAPSLVDLNGELEKSGGSSALFGGSFAVVASSGGGGVASAGAPSVSAGVAGDSSESGGESEGYGDGDGDSQVGGVASKRASSARAQMKQVGVAPFAPISQPIFSVEASEILDRALAPEVEQRMEKYLNP